MIIICRVYNNRRELAEGEPPINEFEYNDENRNGRIRMAKTAWWAARSDKVLLTYPKPGQPVPVRTSKSSP